MTVKARSNTVRFGPFELDLRTSELRKEGARIRLQGQPIQILVLLLERPGELVTQEEVRTKLWPDGTVVEFEHSIKTALRKLRHALGDEAEAPRYIETLPRRGYRFIGSISVPTPAEPPLPDRGAAPVLRDDGRVKLWLLAALVAVFLAGITWGGYRYFNRPSSLTAKDTILISDFVNTTGDPVFDGALRQGVTVQLEQSPFLSIVSEARIQQMLPFMGQPSDAALTPKVGRDLCQRIGCVALVEGSIASLGRQYVLDLKAIDCSTGDSLAEDQETADSKEQVLRPLGQAATKLRSKLGESLGTVHRFDSPIEQATTPSLDALKAYSGGIKLLIGKSDFNGALPLFQRAIVLDPNFAAAYSGLVLTFINLGETDLASQAAKKAYELRSAVSEPERFQIDTNYHLFVSGDLEKARLVCEVWSQTYPRDHFPHGWGIAVYANLGQYDRALDEARANLVLDPTSGLAYGGLTISYIVLGRLKEARATAEEALVKNFDSPFLRDDLYELAFLENDSQGRAQQVAWAAGKPGAEDYMLALESHTAAYFGQVNNARDLLRRAIASADRAEEKETVALYEADAAVWKALFGFAQEAHEHAHAALSSSRGRDVEYVAALGLALANQTAADQAEAERLADDLGKRFPEDTLVRFNYLPTLRAQIALNRGRPAEAIEDLKASVPYELGTTGGPSYPQALFPVYLRGIAYLAGRQASQAAAEFQKMLDYRSIVLNAPIGALARLGLARAYVMEAKAAQSDQSISLRRTAITAYHDFLMLWKDADSDIPTLKEARSEYSKLP